uniref:glutamate synthase (ferredoxin) n=1 Tax=Compsopogon caeruleus TaxID=31354 RepID=A0A1Z1XBE1_9RHOD|nr:glutamate synthase [Compsopogon caeruleus]ARX96140.1 glutamate synthase [Compsopogon caeruleus]
MRLIFYLKNIVVINRIILNSTILLKIYISIKIYVYFFKRYLITITYYSSTKPHLLYDYFKQRFAQVTNPAIDPLREKLVMSLSTYIGNKGNILENDKNIKRIRLESPIINELALREIKNSSIKTITIYTNFKTKKKTGSLVEALNNICSTAKNAIKNGIEIIILSDKNISIEIEEPFIPPLLVIGTLHHFLIKENLRQKVSIIVETGQCWSTHHFACLIGYGASAVCPFLAFETTRQWWTSSRTKKLIKAGKIKNLSIEDAQNNYKKAIELGLLKILSKMGISLISSYQGAQIFECLGLGPEIIETGFCGTVSQIGGLTLDELEKEIIESYHIGFSIEIKNKLANYGFIQYRPGGEYHINNPEMSKILHKAVRGYKQEYYNNYKDMISNRPLTALRDLFEIKSNRAPISKSQVESCESIMSKFCTGGMSLGALSRETHETLAIAMNRIGGKSNSGEGGEDSIRINKFLNVDSNGYDPLVPHLKGLKMNDTARSAIKQIASGRFGVTPEYLVNADQLEIKISQGAKPGEGGQLPGKKVSPYIASLRGCKPGVTLISPPPHHDIYSIEDLSQLIFDLHQINLNAKVSVKLVATTGIGTVSTGVVKGNADIIQISGHEGGTGASPLSSIKHAGSPWELGLSEVHQSLSENLLRDKVLLRVDGGLRTGSDIILASILGAEEFGFGTVAMIATGCIMARICHTNSCPVGVATQREELRARFPGVPEALVNFFIFIAEEIRDILANLGYTNLESIIGHTSLLQVKKNLPLLKTKYLDLQILLNERKEEHKYYNNLKAHSNGAVLDDDILSLEDIKNAIENQTNVTKYLKISNTNRTVGARIAGSIAKKYGNTGFKGTIFLNFYGSAGQSFGAFIIKGLNLKIIGEANDYVGKGMNGGEIIIIPEEIFNNKLVNPVIVGNTCLYGATGGNIYIKGCGGERFGVRNSQACAVIEGVGDHACEYMTGGTIIILGNIGRNLGAGMTGGLVYILSEQNNLVNQINQDSIKIQKVKTETGQNKLKNLIQSHLNKTGSTKADSILKEWDKYIDRFIQIVPYSEENNPEVSNSSFEEEILINKINQ